MKATDGTALKRLKRGGINLPQGNVWMSLQESNSVDIGVSYKRVTSGHKKKDVILKVWYSSRSKSGERGLYTVLYAVTVM